MAGTERELPEGFSAVVTRPSSCSPGKSAAQPRDSTAQAWACSGCWVLRTSLTPQCATVSWSGWLQATIRNTMQMKLFTLNTFFFFCKFCKFYCTPLKALFRNILSAQSGHCSFLKYGIAFQSYSTICKSHYTFFLYFLSVSKLNSHQVLAISDLHIREGLDN